MGRVKHTLVSLFTALVVGCASRGPDAPEPVALTGRVVQAESGAPLCGAQVAVVGRPIGALTDTLGAFRLAHPEVLARDSVELQVQLIGFRSERLTAAVPTTAAAAAESLEIRLRPQEGIRTTWRGPGCPARQTRVQ